MAGTCERGRRSVVVAGGGIPGLTFATALAQAHGCALDVTIVDPSLSASNVRHRGRAFAVASGGRAMLERLGVWDAVGGAAQPIAEMVISDSRLSDPVRPVFLTFADKAEAPFAHMVEAPPLVDALVAAAGAAGVAIETTTVVRALPEGNAIRVERGDGITQQASLLVAADGARSRLREAAGIGWVGRRYSQQGIVATIGHDRPHEGRAYEHFLPSGPFAVLPLPPGGALGHRSSIVWTERAADVPALLGGAPSDVLAEIERRFTPSLGRLCLANGPNAFPLAIGMARSFRAERLALLGDAAHVIHPIAGQGLNLGLAAAASLAEAVTDALRLGLDPGSEDVLAAYERSRRFATLAMAVATDGLNRLFSNDVLPVRLARDFGLGIVDRMPGLKRYFIGEAAAARGTLPRLLRGAAL